MITKNLQVELFEIVLRQGGYYIVKIAYLIVNILRLLKRSGIMGEEWCEHLYETFKVTFDFNVKDNDDVYEVQMPVLEILLRNSEDGDLVFYG